jgi:CAAX protease family protein
MILLNNVAEDIGWTGFVFARFQDRYGPLQAALLTTVFFWLFHVSSFYVDTRSWATTLVLGIFLLPQLASRLIAGWHYNSAGSSVLIAGLFHAMHNAIVNSTGLVAVVDLPQFEVLVIMDGIVVLAGAIHRRRHPRPPRTRPTRIKCRSRSRRPAQRRQPGSESRRDRLPRS